MMKVSPAASLRSRASRKPDDQIVDVDKVIVRLPASHHRIPAPRDPLEHLEQPRLAGSVDRAGSNDGDFEAMRPAELARETVGLGFRLLVDIRGCDGRILVRGRILDVAMNADGRGVNEPSNPRRVRGFKKKSRALNIDVAVVRVRMSGSPVDRGDVHDGVTAIDEPPGVLHIPQNTFDDLNAPPA